MFLNESRCRIAERCLSAFYWRYLHGGHGLGLLYPDKKLIVGNLVHAGLAAHYMEENPKDALNEDLLRSLIPGYDLLDADAKNGWLAELEWTGKVIDRYAGWAAGEDNFAVAGVEQSGSVLLGESCWQCGVSHEYGLDGIVCGRCNAEQHQFVFRLDLLLRDAYGHRVMDHKTTAGSVDARYLGSWEHSTQMWGYCYGAQKQGGHRIGGYSVNIIRKVKAAAEAPDMTKSCPGCGRRKAKGCEHCVDGPEPGRVPRLEKPSDKPFVRVGYTFGEKQAKWFVQSRVRAANKIVEHARRLGEGDPDAFPHNPTAMGCDPDLCWGRYPGEPREERFINEERYFFNKPDYVTEKRLAFEEGV